MDLTDRPRRVLAALVREYIASGEPVPSSILVGAAGLGVSSATVMTGVSPSAPRSPGAPAAPVSPRSPCSPRGPSGPIGPTDP